MINNRIILIVIYESDSDVMNCTQMYFRGDRGKVCGREYYHGSRDYFEFNTGLSSLKWLIKRIKKQSLLFSETIIQEPHKINKFLMTQELLR